MFCVRFVFVVVSIIDFSLVAYSCFRFAFIISRKRIGELIVLVTVLMILVIVMVMVVMVAGPGAPERIAYFLMLTLMPLKLQIDIQDTDMEFQIDVQDADLKINSGVF